MAETGTSEDLTAELRDTEITLGTGKLLGIFFGIAFLCAVFFSFGYMVGRGSSSAAKTEASAPATGVPAGKPSASNKTTAAPQAAGPSLIPAAPARETAPAPALAPAAASQSSGDKTATSSGTYLVQVAAVSKREDADILVSALQKKQYPAFVASTSGDALFHVQVGPFSDPDAAEAMRSRLAADGYNAIVKK